MESIGIIIAIGYFIFGTIIGSFLNVVSLRYNTGYSIMGRSECFSCAKILKWYELIPIISFVFQLGKCAKCKSKISIQYPIVEFFTGIIFLGIFLKLSNLLDISFTYFLFSTFYSLLIFSILIVIFIYDIKHKIIPDGLVYSFVILSLLGVFFNFSELTFSMPSLLEFLAGPILFLPFFLLWFFSGGKWIGLGDGKLALGIGWFLGLSLGANAIMYSFWIGALASVAFMLFFSLNSVEKRITMKSEIPFGPFLILGLVLVFFFEINIFNFIL
jgi:prepilin signal peptidase PulO-like enzyme (type II secretory pathway)